MLTPEQVELLHDAGSKFDGHVTNGSLAGQVKLVEQFITDALTKFVKVTIFAWLRIIVFQLVLWGSIITIAIYLIRKFW